MTDRPGWSARAQLPAFPWDRLAPYAATARAVAGGVIDLSVGTPVDPTPDVVQAALRAAADHPGYPTTVGSAALRDAIVGWVHRRLGREVTPGQVVPAIGTKELVSLLPSLLGLMPGSRVLLPRLAYPTYDVGARVAGCVPVATDDPLAEDPAHVSLVWLNSPSNPTGAVLSAGRMAEVVGWGREHGILVVSDECYLEMGWDAEPVSILDARVCGDSVEGVLALHSSSKRSNMAGYRAGFAVGDETAISTIVEIRKHLGLIVPGPVQAALGASLDDDDHVKVQKERYAVRHALLRDAVQSAGLRVEASEAGLYLWGTRDEDCWDTVAALAEIGVLVAPGVFYGEDGARHVRVALTATDERVEAAVQRLAGLRGGRTLPHTT